MSLFKSLEGTSTQVSEETYKDMYLNFEDALSSAVECLNEGIQMVDELNNVQFAMECIAAHKNSSMVSMEAFTGCKVTAEGRLSMEGDDAEKTLVQKIKEWFKLLWARFQDFFMKFSVFAQACSKKLSVMSQKLGNGNWKAEKLKNADSKCLDDTGLNKVDAAVTAANAISIKDGDKTYDDISKDEIKFEQKLDDTLTADVAKRLLTKHKEVIDSIVASKTKINASLKAAMDSIKVAQNGADSKDRNEAYRKARLNYHVALKNIHICSGTAVRSANKLLAACAKAYKGGMKDALA